MTEGQNTSRQEKAVEGYLEGKPVKQAMLDAGYTQFYVERHWQTFLERSGAKERMKDIATVAAGMSPEGYKAKLSWIVNLVPGKDIPWPSYMDGIKLYAFCVGEYRKEGARPAVPINIHIHREETVIEAESQVLPIERLDKND